MNSYRITIQYKDGGTPYKTEIEVTAPTLRSALITAADGEAGPRNAAIPAITIPSGYVRCPGCVGMGEHQESYKIRGDKARVIDCTTCDGKGYVVASPLPYSLPIKPKDWDCA